MNILLVSQCDKRALTETRRILDQFAERRGERTWQTPITQAGLDTLRRLLKKTARKNTAVACHWIRGLDHSELLWTVGNASCFNAQGAVPTNTTTRNILRGQDENDWHTGEDISLLSALAALLHDLGKASRAFQMRLEGKLQERNQYRHEWVSLRLFEAFVGADDDAAWLARLAAPTPADDAAWLARLKRDGLDGPVASPFAGLARAPLAQAIGWLVLTHHRLPVAPAQSAEESRRPLGRKVSWISAPALKDVLQRIDAGWNEKTGEGDAQILPLYWQFPHGLPVGTELWRKRAARLAQRLVLLRTQPGKGNWLANPYVMHLSRLCLMLADHHYSSLGTDALGKPDPARVKGLQGYPLYANTNGGPGDFNQTLDEHLLGVARHSGDITHALPRFDEQLPRLARHKGLRKRAQHDNFRWQDKAADTAAAMRERSTQGGAFIVNMASTGCGKTLANARIMDALAGAERGMRCAFAMGLRTLTLQTGKAFRDLLSLGDDEVAIRVGGSASRALFEHYERQAEAKGSASSQALLDEEEGYVVFEGNHDAHPLLRRVMHDPQVRALLTAPLLVCTIDHLTPATESERGGRQIAPMLRLMSGDLVLDEPDDFDIGDLPALTRLVHWAGLLGARVLLSSATLPPALVQGLFEAYRNGRHHFQRNRGNRPAGADRAPQVCCAWFDEFNQQQADCIDAQGFAAAHQRFAARRCEQLAKAVVRRRYELLPLDVGAEREQHTARFAELARDAAVQLHAQHHSLDTRSAKRVSFGLIRMANIEPLVEVALALYALGAPDGVQIHLCAYHSQFPLLIRSGIERQLDQALNRRQSDAVFDLPGIRQRLDAHPQADQLFIVLGSPVTEVGRDHDYDWAVVEPSSMRSLIQLAGRIRRHREGECSTPNLRVFDTNLRHFREPGKPAFCRPGFETAAFPLDTHNLKQLLPLVENGVIDARPRITAPPGPLQSRARLVDLEHTRMAQEMLVQSAAAAPAAMPGTRQRGSAQASAPPALNATSWWRLPPADALLTAVLPQQQPFRLDTMERVDLVLRPNEEEDDYELVQLIDKPDGRRGETQFLRVEKSQNRRIDDAAVQGHGISAWGQMSYWQALTELAAELDMPLADCARRFGTVTLPKSKNGNGWWFHPALGFTKYR
ncbi:MAG: type I-F CRISPR-associated helicase Cas3f [Pseudomonadota bacterium]|nr:type I-F CRISPR-associated helicase Cas3f [Pseudomonadota bacterium]